MRPALKYGERTASRRALNVGARSRSRYRRGHCLSIHEAMTGSGHDRQNSWWSKTRSA
jgi:hypothetical protein